MNKKDVEIQEKVTINSIAIWGAFTEYNIDEIKCVVTNMDDGVGAIFAKIQNGINSDGNDMFKDVMNTVVDTQKPKLWKKCMDNDIKNNDNNGDNSQRNIELVSFHFLEMKTEYSIQFWNTNDNEIVLTKKYKTLSRDINKKLGYFVNLDEHKLSSLNKWFNVSISEYISINIFDDMDETILEPWIINNSESDWLWTCIKTNNLNNDILKYYKKMYLNGIFTLPHCNIANEILKKVTFHDESFIQNIKASWDFELILCPNPVNRQIIDFRNVKQNIWKQSKKLKKYKKDFCLSINTQFKKDLLLCKKYHINKYLMEQNNNDSKNDDNHENDGTWINDNLINILSGINNKKDKHCEMISFELWEKKTNELVAVSFGYKIGSILCDYTFMTLKKDKRSIGNLLTKIVCDILYQCGYDMWYWGFKLEYMEEYKNKYNGKEISSKEFWNVLQNSFTKFDNNGKIVNSQGKILTNIFEFVKQGRAVVLPHE